MAHVHTDDLRRALLQQAIGKAAGALPHVQAAQPGHGQPRGQQGAFQLEAAARDVLGLGIVQQLHLGHGRDVIAVLGHLLPGRQG